MRRSGNGVGLPPVQQLLQFCLDLGISECCVCAGSRNSEVVHALWTHADIFQSHPFFEERSAAFFALGRIQATSRPVAVLTTSGTAAAELLPAAIEAHYQALPLVLITADRPARFRGTGAPQAIEQVGLFGPYAQTIDFSADDPLSQTNPAWDFCRPLHLNICLEEPHEKPSPFALARSNTEPLPSPVRGPDETGRRCLNIFLGRPEPLVVLAGCLTRADSHQLAPFLVQLEVPILAEPTSGLAGRTDLAHLLFRGGDRTLRGLTYGRVLRFGGVPSCRAWRDLETRPGVDVLSISRRPFTGLARPSRLLGWPAMFPDGAESTPGPDRWKAVDEHAAQCLRELVIRYPASEAAMLHRLSRSVPSDARLFLGNSLPIREWHLVGSPAAGQAIVANRGANGIDGNLSTFLGFASGARDERESWGLFGDLTTLYDLAAPYALRRVGPNQRCRFVVINNGGGKIFRLLPSFRGLSQAEYDFIENPHRHDFKAWAEAWQLKHVRLDSEHVEMPDLPPSPTVIEVRPDAAQSNAFREAWHG